MGRGQQKNTDHPRSRPRGRPHSRAQGKAAHESPRMSAPLPAPTVVRATQMPADTPHVPVVIVGSGAGGGTLANELAQKPAKASMPANRKVSSKAANRMPA